MSTCTHRSGRSTWHHAAAILMAASVALLSSCSGDDGSQGPPGPPGGSGKTSTKLTQGDDKPGIVVAITGLSGGSGANGNFRVGDTITIAFTVKKDDGTDWDVSEFQYGRTMVSGPTFNYQRVIAEQTNVHTTAVEQADGSYRYTFPVAIPGTYLAPYNDTASFGTVDGELTGQALLDGTYTVGLYFGWNYTVDGESKRDAGNATYDFLFGAATAATARAAVKQDNCNRCHSDLQAHGGLRKNVTLCLLCHTAGAEDKNDPTAAGGTPGVSIDFRVMVHKIHSGDRLPSVQGVATNNDGTRNYAATPKAYELVGFNNTIHDYSGVVFPAWPHALVAMPRDQGHAALSAPNQAKEDAIRTGPSNCIVCHGDPDGSGPLTAPAQGDLHRTQPTRHACGSCHDDIDWSLPYTANAQTMPPQANNSTCIACHVASGNGLAVADAHLHPMNDPAFDSGLVMDVTALAEAGTHNNDGTIDPGEKVAVTFTVKDDAGVELAPSAIGNLSVDVSGPTSNYNLVLSASIPTAKLTGAQPYTVNLPMNVLVERVGVSTGALETFTTAFNPHWNVTGALTSVQVRTGTTTSTTLAAASVAQQNYIDVASATGFARNDYIVIDSGLGTEEYARIQFVDGNRLWFAAAGNTTYKPALLLAHASGAAVQEVTLVTKAITTDFTLNANTGVITEVTEFGAGNVVLCTYTTDFVMPTTYPITLNASPDLGETDGKWTGKTIVDGTYTLALWSARTLTLNLFGETNSYRSTAEADLVDFRVGSATAIEPYELISSATNCYNCHQELSFHGAGRRGYQSCVVCHGAAGPEDRPRYTAANAPATTGVSITFRQMLHKIHKGEDLANASSYQIVGFGSGAYPNNFGVTTFEEVVFPAFPGGTRNCTKCHGASNEAWKAPAVREHPTQQTLPVKRWAIVCGACHDSTDAQAHITLQTTPGGDESCNVCHGTSAEWGVQRVHKAY
ncbi:MAG: hypothetical protein IT458_07615 [Planctomycetes bacterium]|nr:hypothetical protein [Planctomycetota bacterium]